MQFTYPELLWALIALLIPILVHLFQLRRFKKTPFTNVKLLQRVVAKSRKSSVLKKWLLLCTRMLLLAALVLAFAQPFIPRKNALSKKETVIYLDDSFSMQLKKDGVSLLDQAIQELIQAIPSEEPFTLFTNAQVYERVRLKEVQNDWLALPYTAKQLNLDEIRLKAQSFFGQSEEMIKNLIVLSDFQERIAAKDSDSLAGMREHRVRLRPDNLTNVSLDSIFVSDTSPDNLEVTALLSADRQTKDIPVSLFNGQELMAKTAAVFNEEGKA
ncbi:MAG: BatA domain-containing protein, partial [Bacteroidota bacterium]